MKGVDSKDRIAKILEESNLNSPATKEGLDFVGRELDVEIPYCLLMFYSLTDGLCKQISGEIWNCYDIVDNNIGYDTAERLPNYFIFGTNGGGEFFAFRKIRSPNSCEIYLIPAIAAQEDALLVSHNFASFLECFVSDDPDDSYFDILET